MRKVPEPELYDQRKLVKDGVLKDGEFIQDSDLSELEPEQAITKVLTEGVHEAMLRMAKSP